MARRHGLALVTLVVAAGLASCSDGEDVPVRGADLANPASVYCVEHGGRSVIIENRDGSRRGVCAFPDGSQCDEWAYFRGDCAPGNG